MMLNRPGDCSVVVPNECRLVRMVSKRRPQSICQCDRSHGIGNIMPNHAAPCCRYVGYVNNGLSLLTLESHYLGYLAFVQQITTPPLSNVPAPSCSGH